MARVQIINPISTQGQASPAPPPVAAAAPTGMEALYKLFGLNMPGAAPAPASMASSAAPQAFGGFLGSIIGALRGGTGNQQPALHQRPEDIERLVSMSQNPRSTNAGGFFGGMFGDKG